MRKFYCTLLAVATLAACKSIQTSPTGHQPVKVNLDLVNIQDDKVLVHVDPERFSIEETTFFIPKTVPGTYSEDNYGKFVEGFKALDYDGNEMEVSQVNDNSWNIANARNLDLVTYWVNDSYDVEGEEGVFSPSGTNIEANENFMLNLHGFVGYFQDQKEEPYLLEIKRPASLIPGTALTVSPAPEQPESDEVTDVFLTNRYFEIIDHPIMYATPDTTSFMVDNMEVLINVYSPNKVYTSQSIKPGIVEMISAQKRFLGEIDNTSKYAILLYLADANQPDARGFGALEHHTSTVVVLPEQMPAEALQQAMTDVVSHEFFHILTPLGVHSEEIHYFDYNNPKMSKHLWMYEGVTEYFANLFQVNQDLIEPQEFYDRLTEKITTSRNFDDTVPFTVLSENILDEEYSPSYYNVYLKGALIGMALDIRLRELSNGESGILDLMKELSQKYGKDRPFQDDQLISDIVALSYPEIQTFFDTYVTGSTPIPYNQFFEKAGLEEQKAEVQTGYLMNKQVPYVDADPSTKQIFFRKNIGFNSFLDAMGVRGGDVLKSINGTEYNLDNIYALLAATQALQEGDAIEMQVEREGEVITLEGTVFPPTEEITKLVERENPSEEQLALRRAWLKG